MKKDDIEVKAYNKSEQELNVKSTNIAGTSSVLVLTVEIDNPRVKKLIKMQLTVTWKKNK